MIDVFHAHGPTLHVLYCEVGFLVTCNILWESMSVEEVHCDDPWVVLMLEVLQIVKANLALRIGIYSYENESLVLKGVVSTGQQLVSLLKESLYIGCLALISETGNSEMAVARFAL